MSDLIDSRHLKHCSVQDIAPGYPVLSIENAHCRARIALHGAHVIDFQPTGHAPVIYNSPEAIYEEGKAIRGGIPVCWPWFSKHPENPSLPAHGLARYRFWQLTDSYSCPDFTELTFNFDTTTVPAELWPHKTIATLRVRLGQELQLVLTSTNHSHHPITVGGALHSYFQISSIHDIQVDGLDTANYCSTISPVTHTQDGPIRFAGEIDRIYYPSHHIVEIYDPGLSRRIRIEKSGSHSTIVWNPWSENSRAFADLPDTGYLDFVCIETANALGDVHLLPPGASHTLSTTISVHDA